MRGIQGGACAPLKSGYLHQIRRWTEFSKEKFFDLLDIPKSYWNSPSNIDKFILRPIKEELTPLFQGLTIRKNMSKVGVNLLSVMEQQGKLKLTMLTIFPKGNKKNLRIKLFNIDAQWRINTRRKMAR
ncbi:replication initiation protein [Enterococcus faecium]|uniref:replication initiation protein n=1 Tax=Enterococcus faecium TaxID=1352 RepID=UPI001F19D0B3|nr:replication initiation protein [Enterococcus faecium]UKD09845.1 replication initiation protein [Enterococcus faecium]